MRARRGAILAEPDGMENLFQSYNGLLERYPSLTWVFVVAAALLGTLIIKVCLRFLVAHLRGFTRRTHSLWDDVGLDILEGLRSWVVFSGLFFLLGQPVETRPFQSRLLHLLVVVAICVQLAIWGLYVLRVWRREYLDKKITADPSSAAALGLFFKVAQVLLLTGLLLMALDNMGVNITSLIAGLGVGGIAVALAAQNVVQDLLSSLSIVLDKPFVIGDFIISGSEMGTVEAIGIKTTRLRSLTGEELILANKDLTDSRVRNFKRMWQRRVVQKFGVTYDTPAEALAEIPKWVRGFIEKRDKLKFDRCHFANFGSSSLDFELVFYVLDPDYNVFMDLQQELLLEILSKFAAEKIEFAFPTQTVIVSGLTKNQVAGKDPDRDRDQRDRKEVP